MTSVRFNLDRATFVHFAARVKSYGFQVANGQQVQHPGEIWQDDDFDTYDRPTGHYFLFPTFSDCELMETLKINNVYQGVVYTLNKVEGGPYLEMLFRVNSIADRFDGTLDLRSRFDLKDNRVVSPPVALKNVFREIKDYLRTLAGDRSK